MTRHTSGTALLYAAGTQVRWVRAAAKRVDAWGSSLCARQWHASRRLPARVPAEENKDRLR